MGKKWIVSKFLPKGINKPRGLFTGALLLFLFFKMGTTLLIPPIHGFADNRDFWRVMVPAGILYENRPLSYGASVQRFYWNTTIKPSVATTSAFLPAAFSKIFSPFQPYDLRALGFVYFMVFFSGMVALLLWAKNPVLSIGFIWIGLEPTLFLHFQSFFSVAPHLAFWPWLAYGIAKAAERDGPRRSIALGLLSLFLATTKLQFAFLPALVWFSLCFVKRPQWKNGLIFLPALGISFGFAFFFEPEMAKGIRLMSKYQSVFAGIATVRQDKNLFDSLGIDRKYSVFTDQSLPEALMQQKLQADLVDSLEKLSLWKLAWSYLNLEALKNTSTKILKSLERTPLGYLGNFEEGSGQGEFSFSWQFSHLRDLVVKTWPWIFMFSLSGFFFPVSPLRVLFCFFFFHGLSQLPIAVVGDGFYALQRHYIVARLCFDLCFWLVMALIWSRFVQKNYPQW